MNNDRFYLVTGLVCAFVLLMLILLWSPLVGPWSEERKGLAEFRRAEQNRQIRIQEAKAKNEAAEFLAQAEITKAKGVAEANNIMAESLGGPEGYLRWKYIEMLEETGQENNTIVYIPTEAAMPILEAGRISDAAPTELGPLSD
jgi:regulator of protease activity HflC (stomatin/prohibitin superfamily)